MPDFTSLGLGAPPITATSVAAVATMNAIYGLTATATAANTVAETSIVGTGTGSLTIAANRLTAGKHLFIYAYGFIGAPAGPTLRIKAKLNGNIILDTGAATLSAITGTTQWQMSAFAGVRTTGAGGTGFAQGQFAYFTLANSMVTNQMLNVATFAVDTTVTQTLDISAQWGTADPTNTISTTNLMVCILG